MAGKVDQKKLITTLADRDWRLNNLYHVIDEHGQKVPFKLNPVQQELHQNRWFRNVVLKSRQHGITTYVAILFLDACLFEPNKVAAIIAHTKDDAAKIFDHKVKYAYDNLPDWLRATVPARRDKVGELKFGNNSMIYVTNSTRSRTPNYLHISELGLITLNTPQKANEILTGTFPSMHSGNVIFIESTADGGAQGLFYDICNDAQNKQLAKAKLTPLNFKFHFFPWYNDPKNTSNPADVIVTDRMREYFVSLKDEHGIITTPEQQAWYADTERQFGAKIFVQYPSFPAEAFKTAAEGAYYKEQFNRIRTENRITRVPVQGGVPVNTAWDIGMDDYTAIWFYQIVGREVHVVDFYQNCNYGFDHYARILEDRGYHYGTHVGPHDLAVREIGNRGLSRFDAAKELGINFFVLKKLPVEDGIEQARKVLSICYFDEVKCDEGIIALENYRKVRDERTGMLKPPQRSTKEAHAADSFRYLATHYGNTINTTRDKGIVINTVKNYTYI